MYYAEEEFAAILREKSRRTFRKRHRTIRKTLRDLMDAGKLALSVDTIFGAIVVFAPNEHVGVRSTFVRHAGVLLISVLEGRGSVCDLVKRFVFMPPISLVVFMGTLGLKF